ncbi:hypothetical protein B9Z55_022159 [Caenorhabditis nigoni]|uniref:Piwi domain-containing protein n=1 Tax=Caenorhabditis nigoni TaxID=1611254 RepID=A0A2G5TV45_9PELO|nr:hypothetical protein B9Z55_022159 [Caenorhabditis nigoni]
MNGFWRVLLYFSDYSLYNIPKNLLKKGNLRNFVWLCFEERRKVIFHAHIKALEQEFDILTQKITLETVEKIFRQPQTIQNIINKTNMKLGGLNYRTSSTTLRN